jgi:hypothetical protein
MGVMRTLGLDQPSAGWRGLLWLVVLLTLAFMVIYGFWTLVQYSGTPAVEDTSIIEPLITTALGALIGLIVGGAAAPTTGGGTPQPPAPTVR